ncbi:kinase-like domain-containing protein [Coprinopsis sp. MPI-PUGE-AT-0042]|nr:kinase-like domain-containing protein [Coprinopsis sp. MPI-PUGE-AT-0042]
MSETNPYVQEPNTENYTGYQPGGYHPTHLGDTFRDGRYTVVHKLGYGSYSTVWLIRDESQGTFASLKILSAGASQSSSGTELDVLRRSAAGSGEGKRFVLKFFDSFVHQGPNGEHLCVVTEVSGPSLAMFLWAYGPDDMEDLDPELAGTFVWQLAQGVEYLHSCGIVHGDLHLGNMLYHLPALSTLRSSEDIEKYFGAPETLEICVRKDRSPLFDVPHLPRYVVRLPDYALFFSHLFANPSLAELRICDFSESSLQDPVAFPNGIERQLNCPIIHRAPEVLFDNLVSPASDIWALGNTMHQILDGGGPEGRTAIPGASRCSRDDVLYEMVRTLGSKLPERWWNAWQKRGEYFDDQGRWVASEKDSKVGSYPPPEPLGSGMFEDEWFPGGKKEAFVDVLWGMFRYEPGERLTAREVVKKLAVLNLA